MSKISKIKQFPFIVNASSDKSTDITSSADPKNEHLNINTKNATEVECLSQKVHSHAFKKGRSLPNILITGTPGTGKTTLCQMLMRIPYKHIKVGEEIKKNKWYSSYDTEMDSFIFSDSKVRKGLAKFLTPGANIIDFHSIENVIMPSLVDLVVVLRTDNTELFDRLTGRGYSQNKIRENVECEIMQILLEEAREVFAQYPEVPILELNSSSEKEQKENIEKLSIILRLN